MRDPTGISRGSGFVAFSTPEEATRAVCNSVNHKYTNVLILICFAKEP